MSSTRDVRALVQVARRYHLDGRTQGEIAAELGTSRSNVSRMLTAALEQGIVRVSVHDPTGRDPDLETDLVRLFGLQQARVAVGPDGPGRADPVGAVGLLASALLLELAVDGRLLALSWGRALQAMVRATEPGPEHSARLVQLVGGLPSVDTEISGEELLLELSGRLGGAAYLSLHAPAVLSSRDARDALLAEPSVAGTLAEARRADVAVVGIGSPVHGSSARVLQAVADGAPGALDDFWARRPVGDVALRYFDDLGRPVGGPVEERVVGISLEDLRRIPTVVGVVAGRDKRDGVLGALRGGLVDVLVCDAALARSLLATQDDTAAGPTDDAPSPSTRPRVVA